jgi:hypothetical protein
MAGISVAPSPSVKRRRDDGGDHPAGTERGNEGGEEDHAFIASTTAAMRTVIRATAPTRAKKAKTISIQPRISFGGWVQRAQPKRSRSQAPLHASNRERYEGLGPAHAPASPKFFDAAPSRPRWQQGQGWGVPAGPAGVRVQCDALVGGVPLFRGAILYRSAQVCLLRRPFTAAFRPPIYAWSRVGSHTHPPVRTFSTPSAHEASPAGSGALADEAQSAPG